MRIERLRLVGVELLHIFTRRVPTKRWNVGH
jgi:hypothetical protein